MLETGILITLLSIVANMPPAPPPVSGDRATSSQQMLSWNPGEVRCDGVAVQGGAVQRPAAELALMDPQRLKAATYRFAIDLDGRTRSIMRDNSGHPFGQDIGPALAASRFPAGAKRENCEIDYTPKIDPLASAPIADLVAYSIHPTGAKLPLEGWDLFAPVGNCRDKPRPATLLRAYPDFSKVTPTPGSRDWSLVGYDTDDTGRPVNARIAHSTGNAELDAAAVAAVQASRFTRGARTGCLYPYWRAAAKLAPPKRPAEQELRPANAVCPGQIEWAVRPNSYYPPAYRKRAIEGWAIVSFDVAPWGEIGNVKILDAQPSADFGQQATFIVRGARVVPSPQGASGCVKTVNFMMPTDDFWVDEELPATD
ncbi:TonB family protein [Sphingopyxis fribergensis]|uniref:TonB family protein n=1 Tax=Sphingopyxis fribergensis TaxID=1515612 RepID=A0A0A7PGS2_9SPHN|nr:TonB family protein [Sphingopyxis fribergensis]AJA09311.1 TonB family protein [Sphingopyxis fribergensis]